MRLSIILPVFNTYNFLDECINSLTDQIENLQNIEIILVDDGSTDGKSPQKCDFFANQYNYIQVLHKSNGGLSSARNFGLQHAKGEYVWFVDSDDVIAKNAIISILESIENNINSDILIFSFFTYDGSKIINEKKQSLLIDNYDKNEIVKLLVSKEYKENWCAWNKIVKKEIAIKTLFDETNYGSEDLMWSFDLIDNENIVVSSFADKIIKYRVNNQNSISNNVKIKTLICLTGSLTNAIEKMKAWKIDKKTWKNTSHIFTKYSMSILSFIPIYDIESQKSLIKILKQNKQIFKSLMDIKGKILYIMINTLGFKLSSRILYTLKKLKNKK